MTIKRIFCDMDGTLLNSQGRLTDSNAKLISQANLPFTLVSARAPMEMKEAVDKLELIDLYLQVKSNQDPASASFRKK